MKKLIVPTFISSVFSALIFSTKMPKIPARKVATSGSAPENPIRKGKSPGQPKGVEKRRRKGTERKRNYRTRYSKEAMLAALKVWLSD